MATFGKIIDVEVPVVICFLTEWMQDKDDVNNVHKNLCAIFQDKMKMIIIDCDKNAELTEALKVKHLPTYFIYKNGRMEWRKSGYLTEDKIENKINELL